MFYTFKCNNENCKNFNQEFEVNISYKDLPNVKCTECNETKVERVWQPVGIVWKCGGDYNSTRGKI